MTYILCILPFLYPVWAYAHATLLHKEREEEENGEEEAEKDDDDEILHVIFGLRKNHLIGMKTFFKISLNNGE